MQIPGESIGIIADDLTGACDTGLQFHLEGGNTRILLDYTAANQSTSTQVWLINTDSRHKETYDAVAAVRKSVHFLKEQAGVGQFYKKIDSTLRGHIAQECLAILEELGWKAAVIAPAYPDEGRRTVGGYQIVRGQPINKTDVALDPLFPVREAHIPTLLGRTADPKLVGHITLSKVMDGAGPILMAIQEQIAQGKKLIVVDACSDTDLEQLSLAINKMPSDSPVLPCGSAGLAKALCRKWLVHPTTERKPKPTPVIEKQPTLFVIGSASGNTRKQVDLLRQNYAEYKQQGALRLIQPSPAEILGVEPVDHLLEQAVTALKAGEDVIITSSFAADSYSHTMVLAEEMNLAKSEASTRATNLLATMAHEICKQVSVLMLLSGGETAQAVCKTLQTRSMQIVDQIETSIPLMIDEEARWMITKSGGFGNPMSLLNIVKRLEQLEMHAAQPEMPHA